MDLRLLPLRSVERSTFELCKRVLDINGRQYKYFRQSGKAVEATLVTFLTLRAVMPFSPPCFASIVASFTNLQ